MRSTIQYGLAGVALAVSSLSLAQEPAASGESSPQAQYSIDEIIVTARRRDESLQDIPLVVNAVSAETIQKLNLIQFEDIESTVPGLSLSSEGVISRAALRGVTFFPESRTSASVEFYMDEALVESNFLFKSLFDVEQIEVLRGPQGTLRGRSAPSGAITVMTKTADLDAFGGYVSGTGTNREGRNLQGALNIPLIADKLAVRVAGIFDDSDLGGVKSVNSNVDPELETRGGRFSVRFEPVESFDATLMYQYMEVDQTYFNAVAGPGAPAGPFHDAGYNGPVIASRDRRGVTDEPNRIFQRQEILVGRFNWRFDGHELSYLASYAKRDENDLQPLDRGNLLPGSELFQNRPNQSPQRTHELRLSSTERLWDRFDYTVGAFWSKTNIYSTFTVPGDFMPGAFGSPFAAPDPLAFDSRYLLETATSLSEEARETSFFASLTWHISDRTELTVGGRQIRYKGESVVDVALGSALAALPPAVLQLPSCAAVGLSSTYPGTCDVPSQMLGVIPGPFMTIDYPDSDESPFVYNASLSHRFSDDLMAYVSVGSAWRRGLDVSAEVNNATNNPVLADMSVIDPEKSRSFEVGLKSSFLNGRGRLDVAVFRQEFDGLVFRTQPAPYISDNGLAAPTISNRTWTVNADAIVEGVDLTAAFALTPQWSLSLAVSYADGRVDNDAIPCRDSDFDGRPDTGAVTVADFPEGQVIALCKSRDSVSRSPKWNANVQSEYFMPLASGMEGYLRGLLNYYPSNSRQSAGFTVDSYSLLNVYVGVRDQLGAWDVSLFVKNALDTGETLSYTFEPVQSSGAVETNFGPSGYHSTSYTAPREVGVSFRYAFGAR